MNAPAITTTEGSGQSVRAPCVRRKLGKQSRRRGHVSYGDIDSRIRDADIVVREHLKIHPYSSTTLEPFACLAESTPERLTVWCNASPLKSCTRR